MPSRAVRKVFKLCSILLLASAVLTLTGPVEGASSQSDQEEWAYYGYSPAANYTPIDVEWGAAGTVVHLTSNGTSLTVVGYNDSTRVEIYDITGASRLLDSFTLDRMVSHTMLMPLDIYFKVVSDKPVAVLLHGGIMYELSASRLFYPSTDGGYAGKEFIFHAIAISRGQDHYAYGVEQSKLTLYDSEGKVVKTLNVPANGTARLPLIQEGVYRIISTGRVMVYSTGTGFDLCPSTLGGKVGRLFYSYSPRLVIIAQDKSASVRLVEAGRGTKIAEKDLSPGEAWFVNRTIAAITSTPTSDTPKHVLIQSTEDIEVYSATTSVPSAGQEYLPGYNDGMQWISSGVSFVGVKPNQPVTVFVVSRAVVFSPEADAHVNVGGIRVTVEKGGYKDLGASGILTLSSNATLIVQVVSQVATRNIGTPANPYNIGIVDLRNFGSYLISPQAVSVTYPPPKPAEEGGTPDYTLIGGAAAVAVAAAAAVVILILRKRR